MLRPDKLPTSYLEEERVKFIKRMEGDKENLLEKYVTRIGDNLTVNWEALMKDKHAFTERASEGVEPIFYYNILRYLEDKGVLSLRDEGNFLAFAGGMDIGPITSMFHYRFTRRCDAEQYAKAESKNEEKSVKVAKISHTKKR